MLTKDALQNGVFTCLIKINWNLQSRSRSGSPGGGFSLKVCLWTWPPGDVKALVFTFLRQVFY